MISKLLDIARLESEGLVYDFKNHNLVDVLQGLVARLEVAANEAGRELVVDLPDQAIEVDIDRERLLQVFENLLENSLKFAPEGEKIHVSLELSGAPPGAPRRRGVRGTWVTVSIADRGPGVPDQHKSTIFKEFQQLRLAGQGRDGVGLGLAICREIAEAHQGVVWVDDNPGGGSVFRVAIPRRSRAGVAATALRARGMSGEGRRRAAV